MRDIINKTYAGSTFNSIEAAAVACLIDVLTACGSISHDDAFELARSEGREGILEAIRLEMDFDEEQLDALSWAWFDAVDELKA